MNPDTCYEPDVDPKSNYAERMIDRADRLRDERKDREWEAAMEKSEQARKEEA